jgi:hypothetical protein
MGAEIINGSRTHFGPRTVQKDFPYEAGDGSIKQLIAPLLTVAGDADLLEASANDETVVEIPAHSLILDAKIYVKTAFTATTAASITAGSETDPNGLITAAGVGAKAALTANSWQTCDGALVGAKWATADESVVAAWNAADSTAAGEGAILIRYIPPLVE